MSLDRLSLSTIPANPFFNDRQLGDATGFIWKRRERYYLITNWHVVSGLNFFTNMHLLERRLATKKITLPFPHPCRRIRARPNRRSDPRRE